MIHPSDARYMVHKNAHEIGVRLTMSRLGFALKKSTIKEKIMELWTDMTTVNLENQFSDVDDSLCSFGFIHFVLYC